MQTQNHRYTGLMYHGVLSVAAVALGGISALIPVSASAQVAAPPYSIELFAVSPPGNSQPDSIIIWHDSVIVGFGDGVAKDGTDGKSSTIIEFSSSGRVKRTFSVPGHNDGLRLVGEDKLWSMQNEDGNPNLVIIDLETGNQTRHNLPSVDAGGGFDDIAVLNGSVYFTASNPGNNPNTSPALVRAALTGNTVTLDPVLPGNAQATDITTGKTVTLNLQDPDSMTTGLNDDLVFVSQADGELVFVNHIGAKDQSVAVLPLSSPVATVSGGTFTIDDTAFAHKDSKSLMVTDLSGNAIYKIKKSSGFERGQAYSASDSYGIVGTLDVKSGVVTPIVTGLISARGLAFVREREDQCERE
jgi:hypothetical protein